MQFFSFDFMSKPLIGRLLESARKLSDDKYTRTSLWLSDEQDNKSSNQIKDLQSFDNMAWRSSKNLITEIKYTTFNKYKLLFSIYQKFGWISISNNATEFSLSETTATEEFKSLEYETECELCGPMLMFSRYWLTKEK